MSNDLVALSTIKPFNNLAKRAADKGAETLALMWKAGEVAKKAKASIPHGRWMGFVETHYDVNHSTVTRWIQFHETVPESKLCTVHNLAAGIKMLDPPKEQGSPAAPKKTPPPKGTGTSSGSSGGGDPFDEAAPDAPEAPETPPEPEADSESPEPPEAPETKPGDDLEPCPNCRKNSWSDDGDGLACDKCHHPYGESTGGPDEDRIQTQNAKTRKTIEALLRAFDDLQAMKASQLHPGTNANWTDEDAAATLEDMGVIRACKAMLTIVKRW